LPLSTDGKLVSGAIHFAEHFKYSHFCVAICWCKRDFLLSGELTWMSYYSGHLLIFLAIMND